MQAIRQTQQLNKRELENAIPPSASWHADYRDTAWIYIGGLPFDLTEGDVVTIFSQFGSPTHLNMVRDRETGKSKGFGFLKYEDQRSCDLAVDNLTGAEVLGKLLRVDHTRYKKKDDEDEDTYRIDRLEAEVESAKNGRNGKRGSDTEESDNERRRRKKHRPMLREEEQERVLDRMQAIKANGEDEDAVQDYVVRRKRDEIASVRVQESRVERKHRHRHRDNTDRDKEDESRRRRQEDNDRNRAHRHKGSRHLRGGDVDRSARRESGHHTREDDSDASTADGGVRVQRDEGANKSRRDAEKKSRYSREGGSGLRRHSPGRSTGRESSRRRYSSDDSRDRAR